jgi:hypothetical protein
MPPNETVFALIPIFGAQAPVNALVFLVMFRLKKAVKSWVPKLQLARSTSTFW